MCTEKESKCPVEPYAETILEMLSLYNENLLPIGRRRKVPVKIRFPKSRSETEIPLMSAAKFLWFSIFNGYDKVQNEVAFKEYQKVFSWLGDDYAKTVRNLKLLGVEGNVHMTIMGLLTTESDKDRTITFMHAGRKEGTIISSYLSCLEYCQEKDSRLIRPSEVYSKTDLGKFTDVEKQLFPYISIHPAIRAMVDCDGSDGLQKCREIIEENKDLFLKPRTEREVRFLPKRLKNLLTIGSCMLNDNSSEVENVLLNYSTGFIITYISPQTKVIEGDRARWAGRGMFFVKSKSVNFFIKCQDSTLLEVSSSKPQEITQHMNLLTKVLKILKINKDCQLSTNEGVRMFKNQAHYTTTKGAPLKPLSYTEDRRGINYETEVTIKNASILELEVRAVNKWGSLKAESIRFKPAAPGNGDCKYRLDANRARETLIKIADCAETNTVRQFCQDSLLDRLSRLKLFTRKKIRNLYATTQGQEITDEEAFQDLEDDFWECDNMDDDQILDIISLTVGDTIQDDDLDSEYMRMIDDTNDMDNLIDEADLFAEVKNTDSQLCNYEDLILWDDFINNFQKQVKFTMNQVLSGDYFLPVDSKVQKLLRSLISLKIIPSPKPISIEEDEEETFNFSAFD
jgi:hypothetical protein